MEIKYTQQLAISKRVVFEAHHAEPSAATNKYALSFIMGPSSTLEGALQVSAYPETPSSTISYKHIPCQRAKDAASHAAWCAVPLQQPDTRTCVSPILRQPKKNSRLCAVVGCMKRSKHAKLCWSHGGSVKCKVAHCTSRAKSKGVCWAHGGGKRCLVPSCSRSACVRTQNYCSAHFDAMRVGNKTSSVEMHD